jgi:hypothetical protein
VIGQRGRLDPGEAGDEEKQSKNSAHRGSATDPARLLRTFRALASGGMARRP